MPTAALLSVEEWSASYNIEVSFLYALQESGLIEITTIEQASFIPVDNLRELEQMSHLHYDLGINLEGIETILHLLQRVSDMQNEMAALKNRLRLFEPE